MRRFGEKLRALRKRNRLTLNEAASKFGFNSHGHLSDIELGKKTPTVEFVLRVADFFEVTTDELLRDEIEINMSEVERLHH